MTYDAFKVAHLFGWSCFSATSLSRRFDVWFGIIGGISPARRCLSISCAASPGLHLHDGVAAGCRGGRAGIRLLKNSSIERRQLHERAALLRRRLCRRNSHRDNPSHIAPVIVGDPILCQEISDRLHEEFSIYVQLINYPTVPRDTERLRLTPSAAT